jgi:collagenase-like PrtC family protease
MDLTVGPNQYFWAADTWAGLYDDLAKAPVNRVVLGELVCSKRLPFFQDRIPDAIATLVEAGKEVALTSLALVTLKRERKQTASLIGMEVEIEVNDLTALAHIPEGTAFSVGPLVNVYNETTLAGRIPLAISGRCYHARLHGRTKDNCQFACEDDPDGLDVRTLDDQPFLTMNGVQTLSGSYAAMIHQIERLEAAGVSALRLSPQSADFAGLCRLYRQLLDGEIDAAEAEAGIIGIDPDQRLSDGFLDGERGADWSGRAAAV